MNSPSPISSERSSTATAPPGNTFVTSSSATPGISVPPRSAHHLIPVNAIERTNHRCASRNTISIGIWLITVPAITRFQWLR